MSKPLPNPLLPVTLLNIFHILIIPAIMRIISIILPGSIAIARVGSRHIISQRVSSVFLMVLIGWRV
jgi:hypothetical protein